jgi:hypothetical protein
MIVISKLIRRLNNDKLLDKQRFEILLELGNLWK